MGKSSGSFSNSTTMDFADDVNTSLEYLKKRKEVNLRKLGMLGHSEGGMIAPMVASKRNDIDFIVLLAAPGQKVTKLMQEQNIAILLASGFDKKAADAYGDLYYRMETAVLASKDPEDSKVKLNAAVDEWKKNTAENIIRTTTGIRDDSSQVKFVQAISASLNSPWFKYFLQFDPYPYLSALHCRVLALNGDKDLQVLSKPNLAGIKTALQKSKSPGFEVKEMPGLNHLFQHCKKCTLTEYGQLEESFSPEVLHMISNWILKN
jgi:pimeloyl-ACP methyl ester carboxylesterase